MASHAESLALREQFETPEQQKDASTLGMWIFLVTEIMFFGGLFTGYIIYRSYYPEVFAAASSTLNAVVGAANTVILLCSSLTMVLAVHAAQVGSRRLLVLFLILTILLGCAFLGVKAFEWAEKYHHHHIPGFNFHWDGPEAGHAALFFSLYFLMTGMHAMHMVVGVGLMAVIAWQAASGRFTPEYYTPVDVSGLYWHFVDVVWIFLFPLLYLIGRHLG